MICMEEVGAMVKEIWKKVIWPVMAVLFLAVVFRPLCIAEGGIDYWKLLFLMGIPFGAQKMFVWLIPSGYGIGETVGIFALNLLVGGVIGSFILVWRLSEAVFTLMNGLVWGVTRMIGVCQ